VIVAAFSAAATRACAAATEGEGGTPSEEGTDGPLVEVVRELSMDGGLLGKSKVGSVDGSVDSDADASAAATSASADATICTEGERALRSCDDEDAVGGSGVADAAPSASATSAAALRLEKDADDDDDTDAARSAAATSASAAAMEEEVVEREREDASLPSTV
jgi:hypothetical protein